LALRLDAVHYRPLGRYTMGTVPIKVIMCTKLRCEVTLQEFFFSTFFHCFSPIFLTYISTIAVTLAAMWMDFIYIIYTQYSIIPAIRSLGNNSDYDVIITINIIIVLFSIKHPNPERRRWPLFPPIVIFSIFSVRRNIN